MSVLSSDITEQKLGRAVELYPKVIQRSYERRIKTEKKQAEAIQRDEWRYGRLPNEVDHDKGMTLEQLERLVQWKITHGASRPFLPAMIRKNDAATVLEVTSAAAKALSALTGSSSVFEAVDITLAAMATASKLSGVGPATASLVLAVYKPDLVPFFQDELWTWCFPGKIETKLKYDKKEYEMLSRKCWELKSKLGEAFSMVKLEKASFVLQHLDLLEDSEKKFVEDQSVDESSKGAEQAPGSEQKDEKVNPGIAKTDTKRTASAVQGAPELEDESHAGPRRSKRARK